MKVLVLEASTSSAKGMIFSQTKGVEKTLIMPYPKSINSEGQQNSDKIFDIICNLSREISHGEKIDIVSLCGAWHSLLVCNKNSIPVTPCYTWEYMGASHIAQKLRNDKEFTDFYYHESGCMVHAIYPFFKILQLQEQGLDFADKLIYAQASYFFYKLTGHRVTTASMISGLGYLDVKNLKYSEKLLNYLGLKENQFESIATSGEHFFLNKNGANLLGLDAEIPIVPANPDGALNQVGARAYNPASKVMTLSVGTSAALRFSSNVPNLPRNPSIWCYVSPYSWLSGAATSGACNCVDWAKSSFFQPNVSYQQIESNDYDAENLPIFLPFIFGERCPGWNDNRNAEFKGIQSSHKNVDFFISVMEGVLFNIKHCYDNLTRINGYPSKIILSGGILNSKLWTQMCADILEHSIECSQEKQSSMIGAAFLGLNALGIDIDQIPAESSFLVCPDFTKKEMYRKRYQKYLYYYNDYV